MCRKKEGEVGGLEEAVVMREQPPVRLILWRIDVEEVGGSVCWCVGELESSLDLCMYMGVNGMCASE